MTVQLISENTDWGIMTVELASMGASLVGSMGDRTQLFSDGSVNYRLIKTWENPTKYRLFKFDEDQK